MAQVYEKPPTYVVYTYIKDKHTSMVFLQHLDNLPHTKFKNIHFFFL